MTIVSEIKRTRGRPRKPKEGYEIIELGDLNWREVADKGFLQTATILDLNPLSIDEKIDKSKTDDENRKTYKYTICFDEDFLTEKTLRHFLPYFSNATEAKKFIDQIWEMRSKKELTEEIKSRLDYLSPEKIQQIARLLQEVEK